MVFKAGNKSAVKHGLSGSRLYSIYRNIKTRCYNKKSIRYKDYGGRGIVMCDDWDKSFDVFYSWAITSGYSDDLIIDREDNNIGYGPSNCRWVTVSISNRNQRSNVLIEIDGEARIAADWAKDPRCSVTASRIRARIAEGWAARDAVFVKKMFPAFRG